MTEKDELLPCPFCGGSGELDEHKGRTASKHYTANAYCVTCGLSYPEQSYGETKDEAAGKAISVWNKRHEAPCHIDIRRHANGKIYGIAAPPDMPLLQANELMNIAHARTAANIATFDSPAFLEDLTKAFEQNAADHGAPMSHFRAQRFAQIAIKMMREGV